MVNGNTNPARVPEHLRFIEPFMDELEMGVMLVDTAGRLCWLNEHVRKMDFCCQPLEQVREGNPLAIDFAKCGDCPLGAVCRDPSDHRYFCRRQPDAKSQLRTFTVLTHGIKNDADEVAYYVHFIRDISEKEWAFKEKHELQLVLANVLDNSADAIITLDMNDAIYSWNRGAWQVFGYTKDDIRQRPFSLLIPNEETAKKSFDEVRRLLGEQGFVRNHRTRMITKDGRVIDVAVTETIMRNVNGEPFGHSLVIRDISKLVHLERSLSQKVIQLTKLLQLDDIIRSAKTLQEIYNAILVAITAGEGLRFNRAYLFMVNPMAHRLIGVQAVGPSSWEEAHQIYSRHSVEHLTLAETIRQHSVLSGQVDVAVNDQIRRVEIPLADAANPLIRCLKENRPYMFLRGGPDDLILKDFFSQIYSEQFVAVPLVWQDQKLGLVMADNFITRRDISMEDVQFLSSFANRAASAISTIQLQEDLQAKVEELKNAYRQLAKSQESNVQQERLAALGEMSSKVAHEIRNPLVSIGGFARLMIKSSQTAENKKYLNIIIDEASRLEGILEEVLGYVKSPSADVGLCDVGAILSECRLLVEKQHTKQAVQFEEEFDPKLPPIVGNEYQLKQAFLNVMQNGMEAMGRGGLMRVLTRREGEEAIVRIADSGIGIRKEQLNQLFQPFFTTKSRGVGLGLSITKQIIEQQGGRILVQSEEGKGTVFEIRLPIRVKEVADA